MATGLFLVISQEKKKSGEVELMKAVVPIAIHAKAAVAMMLRAGRGWRVFPILYPC